MSENNIVEFDLMELFIKIVTFFKKYFILLIVSVLFGTIISIFLYFRQTPYYISSMTLRSSYLLNEDLENVLKNLENATGDNVVLADLMDIDEESASQIKSIKINKIESIVEEEKVTFSLNLIAEVFDNSYFDTIVKGVNFYVSQNDLVKELMELTVNNYNELIAQIDEEIKKVNANQIALTNAYQQKSGTFILTELGNGSSGKSSEIIDLIVRKQGLQQVILQNRPVTIYSDFLKKSVAERNNKNALITFLIFVFSGFGIALTLEIFKFLKKNLK
jgi:hypothetical protein